ncbi:MAG: alginate export family protein [Candidatus Omnitrophica bacterium]|nr:alginate export family protein [Candidatus Omnitrophota bacterium]
MRRLILVGLLAFAVALVGTAYAEPENIKVSGDVNLKAMTIHNYDLKLKQKNESGQLNATAVAPDPSDDDDNVGFLLSTVHLQVDADLTDNVSATVQLVNQRPWDAEAHAAGRDTDSINIDQAYVVLKEFLYSPLTVIAGRQDITYGNGFIVGAGLLADPDGAFASLAANGDTNQAQMGQEHSDYNSYDAVRLILDFAPITVEGLFSKINETGDVGDDQTLYGALVNYKLDQWNAEIEPYWFFKKDEDGAANITVNDAVSASNAARTYESNEVHTTGLRLAASPIENLSISGEGAHQFGEITDTTPQVQTRDRDAWGANIDVRYNWVNAPWTPTTGVGWVFYSGEDSSPAGTTRNESDKFNAWDPMFRGSFQTYIQDFLTGQDAPAGLYTTFDANDTAATTNRHLFYFDVGLKALEDLTLWGRYTHARFDKAPRVGRDDHAGDEVDLKATYDYTEDVQLAFWSGLFLPGSYYDEADSNARGNDLAWTGGAAANVKF